MGGSCECYRIFMHNNPNLVSSENGNGSLRLYSVRDAEYLGQRQNHGSGSSTRLTSTQNDFERSCFPSLLLSFLVVHFQTGTRHAAFFAASRAGIYPSGHGAVHTPTGFQPTQPSAVPRDVGRAEDAGPRMERVCKPKSEVVHVHVHVHILLVRFLLYLTTLVSPGTVQL